MKRIIISILILNSLSFSGCHHKNENLRVLSDIRREIESGNLTRARLLAEKLEEKLSDSDKDYMVADSLSEIADRTALEFSVDEKKADEQLSERMCSFNDTMKKEWERMNWLECRMIDGKKMYFNRAVSNLFLLREFHSSVAGWIKPEDQEKIFRREHVTSVLKSSRDKDSLVVPIRFRITYTITVNADAVPEGETIRCWLPFPAQGFDRQDEIKLISSSEPDFIMSPENSVHSTVYMEKQAVKGIPTLFKIIFSYRSSSQHFSQEYADPQPYDKSEPEYISYTSEQLPQIRFTTEVRHQADSLAGDETSTEAMVRKIYLWFKGNIPWAGALEYSVMPDIPGYVIKNMRGDCGMQTLLFMSMLRYKGIPVRWQSGWMVPPGAENLHDWCEVYYEGKGWVPVDVSYDLQNSDDREIREFYLSGIDAYRLIINRGIAGSLYPEKKFLRSEPYDFQRGELEWSGGNLYFDKWDYNMEIEYLP